MAEETPMRPSISSVDARVGRLEESQDRLEQRVALQEGTMELIKLEQQHIREIMTSRFVSLENQLSTHTAKLDTFIGKMEALIEEGMRAQGDLHASPLGRQIDERLQKVESWEQVSRAFHSEVRGMTTSVRTIFGTSIAGLVLAIGSLIVSAGAFK